MLRTSSRRVRFDPVDPFGDGLGDAIAAMRRNPESLFNLWEPIDPHGLFHSWSAMLEEARRDPDWFTFANSEQI